ncbi:MAG: S-layer homology domain-containing protein, partial [Thermofilum sp.]
MPFADIDPIRWSAGSIERVFRAGVMSGYPDGTFRPEAPLTREEAASLADRLLLHMNYFAYLMPFIMPAVVCVHRGDALGSGSYVRVKDGVGYILTNRHVVQREDGTVVKELTLIKNRMPNFQ